MAAKRKAAGPRLTQSRYEQLGRDLTAADEAFTTAQLDLDRAQGELAALEEQRTELEARRDALRADPAMRDAERLEQLREDAERKEKAARDRESDRNRQASQVQKYTGKTAQAAHQAGIARDKFAGALRQAEDASASARCARQHRTAVATLDAAGWDAAPADVAHRAGVGYLAAAATAAAAADGPYDEELAFLDAPAAPAADMLARARREAQSIVERRERAVAELGRLLEESAERERKLRAAQAEEGSRSAGVQAAADRVTAADQAISERMGLLLDAYRSYLSGLAELRVADPDELMAVLEGWGLTGDGANPAAAIVDDAARTAGQELGRRAGELTTRRARHVTRAGSSRRKSADCARAATTPRRSPTREPPACARAVQERRCGR